jgi:heme/copper-type cytochrome/quinol oxidase subunit 4
MVAKARHEQLETSLSVGLVSAIFLLSVAWFARHNARMTRNAAALALLLCATFYGLIQVLMPSLTDNSGHDWGLTTIVIGLLMLLTMIASALFVWMQRPARGVA